MKPEEFETIEVTSDDGLVMVELDWIGEGSSGDYEEDNPEDEPLLRYTLMRKFESDLDEDKWYDLCDDGYDEGEFAPVRDGSYCTNLNVTANREHLMGVAKFLLNYLESDCRDLTRQKRLYEQLSWISLADNGEIICKSI